MGAGSWACSTVPEPLRRETRIFAVGTRLDFDVADSWGIGAGAAFRYYAGLLNGVTVGVTSTYRIPARSAVRKNERLPPGFTPLEGDGRGFEVIGLKTSPIFPVFYKYYDEHPLAEVALRNFERVPAQAVKVTALLKGYMDSARECLVPVRVEPGRDATAQVFALFNDRLLEIAETTKVALVLTVEYSQYGKTLREEYSPSLEVLFRNAMTWDDDRRMAAFISARDPAANGFARGVLSATRAARNPALSQDLQSAMLLYEALRSHGLTYVKDPASALNTSDRAAVDSLQFPQQTLEFRSGDCDDLTILMCSLLEAIGIETAFITTPGHVFPAFALDIKPAEATKIYGQQGDFILRPDRVWVPLEMTTLSESFLGSWKEGSREWEKAGTAAALYPVRQAWGIYAPVVVSGTVTSPPTPSAASLSSALKSGIQGLIDREFAPRAAVLLQEAKKPGASPRTLNSLGVLYARYGSYDKAQEQFAKAAARGDYLPAMINLGNVYLTQKQFKAAAEQFRKVLRIAPNDPVVLSAPPWPRTAPATAPAPAGRTKACARRTRRSRSNTPFSAPPGPIPRPGPAQQKRRRGGT